MADRPPPPTDGDDESTVGAPDAVESVREAVRRARAQAAPPTAPGPGSGSGTSAAGVADQRWRPTPRATARPDSVERAPDPSGGAVLAAVAPPTPVAVPPANAVAPAAPRPRDRRWTVVAVLAVGAIVLGVLIGWIVAKASDDDAPAPHTPATTSVAESPASSTGPAAAAP